MYRSTRPPSTLQQHQQQQQQEQTFSYTPRSIVILR
jgi:hypothetical protein